MPGPAFVYVANSQTRTIRSFRLEVQSGQLTPVESVTVAGAPSSVTSLPIAVDLKLGVLWASIRYQPWLICTYAIDRNTGRLTHMGEDRKSTRLNSSHIQKSRMPSSA